MKGGGYWAKSPAQDGGGPYLTKCKPCPYTWATSLCSAESTVQILLTSPCFVKVLGGFLSRMMIQSDVTPRKIAVAAVWSWRQCQFRWSSPEAVAVVMVREDGSLDGAQGRGRSGRRTDIRESQADSTLSVQSLT